MADKLTIHDLRATGFCVSGIKTHYEGLGLDLSFRDFVRHGLDMEIAEGLDDAHAMRGVEKAKERIAATEESS